MGGAEVEFESAYDDRKGKVAATYCSQIGGGNLGPHPNAGSKGGSKGGKGFGGKGFGGDGGFGGGGGFGQKGYGGGKGFEKGYGRDYQQQSFGNYGDNRY